MKTTTIVKSIVTAILLSGSATVLMAQDAPTSPCPFGNEPGSGQKLSPEQCDKQCDGMCLTGSPRGQGQGKGKGQAAGKKGAGQGKRQGLQDGTGPRSATDTCPNDSQPKQGGRR